MQVVLIDDHTIFTELLEMAILQIPGVTSVEKFGSGDDFVYVKREQPGLVILDIRMPGIDGIKVIEYCRQEYSGDLKILVLSFMTNIHVVKQAIKTGANGYVSKSASMIELISGINDIIDGKQYFSSSIKNEMVKNLFVTEEINFHLTERERAVMEMVCKGLTMKEIAYELEVTYHTVHYHYKNIMKKLKVNKSRDLIVFAMMNGLYMPDIDM